jgi:hypothetical protein
VNDEAGCTLCSQARVLKKLIPVARGYSLKIYECASCNSNLLLVTRLRMPNKTRAKPSRRKKFKAIDAALKRAAALNVKHADRLSARSPPMHPVTDLSCREKPAPKSRERQLGAGAESMGLNVVECQDIDSPATRSKFSAQAFPLNQGQHNDRLGRRR